MARKPIDLRQYLRRPDREFWRDLLRSPPLPTESDAVRRERLARAALGLATLVAVLYALATLVVASRAVPVVVVNLAGALSFGTGMWLASLGQHRPARAILMCTLVAQVAMLLWLTGNILGVGVFAITIAGLAAALYTEHERRLRVLFLLLTTLLFLLSVTQPLPPRADLSGVPSWLLTATRLANACFALYTSFLLIAMYQREVLRSDGALVDAREKSDRLINAILPRKIADELRNNGGMIANRHPEVTVLFADIAGFTPWASQQDPETVVALLEKIFSRFDACVAATGAEKIKTIGDAYMVISGAPDPRSDHAHVIVGLALRLLDEVDRVREETGIPVNLRLGIHTGPVIAGVIGALRFSYDVWGDTVNTASRMESHGEPGRVQASRETRDKTMDAYDWELRGTVCIKGKGEMETWWLRPQQHHLQQETQDRNTSVPERQDPQQPA
jgi:adenylate cyclase